MAAHFQQLKIKKLIKETPNAVSIEFDIPAHLQEAFAYREGQNITLRAVINGEEVRRSYSLCTAPHENQIKVAIKKVDAGVFSTYANEVLKEGDSIDVMPPVGKFCSANKAGNYLAIAAGSGITPVLGIIKHILQTQADSFFTLVYGNKNVANIIFFEEIEALKNTYMQRFNCVHVLSKERKDADVNFGRIDTEKLEKLSSVINFATFDAAYICGPEQMIFSASDFLQQKGIEKTNIHFELFTSPNQQIKKQTITDNTEFTGAKTAVTLKLDGRTILFDMPQNGTTILDAALQEGADLPYACKGGVCCTCRAKLTTGKVTMAVNYALEEDEVVQGFILTCQSTPTTDAVTVDFDVK
jgi:ring-1,2-phenylacetyl-CoA epoxidase subunit PaaE